MKFEFAGGARTVTGSSFIIRDADFNVMVDCGMFQGRKEVRERNYIDVMYNPQKIDTLLLTHAHIDHSGLIPKLVKNGFFGNIYATKSTTDLCSIMLPDSAHIQEMDVKWINKKKKRLGRKEVEPLYTFDDVEESLSNFVPVSYGETVQIHPRIEVCFRDAGHILGSSIIEMWIDGGGRKRKLVFSGDLGSKDQAIIRDPEIIKEADILFIESTYGNRKHKTKEDTYKEFKDILLDSYNKKGNIIIPAFAIERTQELIYTLGKLFTSGEIPRIPVYIDSPLAISATEIFRENRQCFDEATWDIIMSGNSPLDFPNLHFTRETEESKRLNREAHGAIIISASGMCTAGRIKHHLKHNIYKPESSVIFVGYQAEGTLGRRIIDGAKQVRLYGEDVAVKAQIHTLGGFSAHADRDGLLEWMGHIDNPDLTVFVVHGEEESSLSFADAIEKEYGYRTIVPQFGETVNIETMKPEGFYQLPKKSFTQVEKEITALLDEVERLQEAYQSAKEHSRVGDVTRLQEDIHDTRELVTMIIDDI